MEIIGEAIAEFVLQILNIGAMVRWCFLRKKYSYKEIAEQKWTRIINVIALLVFIAAILVIAYWP